jgi:lysophospholipase L1-like esterase
VRRRHYGREKASLKPLIVLTNILIAGVVLLMVYLIYKHFTEEIPDAESGGNSSEAPEISDISEISDGLLIPEIMREPEELEMTRATTTPPPGLAAVEEYIPAEFDEEFFENALFIGDSIMTGIHLYGHVLPSNVFAKVGVNPDSVAYTEIDNQTALQKAVAMRPERIYIMLGSNGISYMEAELMLTYMESFMSELGKNVPNSEIILLTIPPVTLEYEQEHPETTQKINYFNALLLESAANNNYLIVDTASVWKTNAGFLAPAYAEIDGLHFKNAAYKAMLSYIQFTLE